jgi:hypothetical protein
MPALLEMPNLGLRIVSRRSSKGTVKVSIRPVRPSLLDLRLQGDAWITPVGDRADVCFGRCVLSSCAALPLDLPGLNAQLQAMRHRSPRRKS